MYTAPYQTPMRTIFIAMATDEFNAIFNNSLGFLWLWKTDFHCALICLEGECSWLCLWVTYTESLWKASLHALYFSICSRVVFL